MQNGAPTITVSQRFDMTPRDRRSRYRATLVAALAGLMIVQALPGRGSHLLSIRRGLDEEVSTLSPPVDECLAGSSPVEHRKLLQAGLRENYGKLPLSFESDEGQNNPNKTFFTRGDGYSVTLTPTEAVFALNGKIENKGALSYNARVNAKRTPPLTIMRMQFIGANLAPKTIGSGLLPGKCNYLIGNDPNKWRTNVSSYSGVRYENVYDGIDLVYYGNQRLLEYDLILAPGADYTAITLAYPGSSEVHLNNRSDLVLRTEVGEFLQHRPVVYQRKNGVRDEIEGRYILRSNNRVGFEIGDYDPGIPLIIDPSLSYSTYLGGAEQDSANGIALDTAGNAYIVGAAASPDFPTTRGSFQPVRAAEDETSVFVAKLDPTGTALVYSTYIGGRGKETGNGIAVDSEGNVYITGQTLSLDFPTTSGALQVVKPTFRTAFVTKLDPSGSSLVYSTYLGGRGNRGEAGLGIAVDSAGSAYVTGLTDSRDFPTVNAFQSAIIDGLCVETDYGFRCSDAFVSKLNGSGSGLVYSTFLGGDSEDEGRAICVDSSGSAYVTGRTESPDFPVAPAALQTSFGGIGKDSFSGDGFVAKFNASGNSVDYCTYLGGSEDDLVAAIDVDQAGNAYVTGSTTSTNFPVTSGAFQSSNGGSAVYKSTDEGIRWTPAGNGLPSNRVLSLAIDPGSPSSVYVGTSNGIFKTVDGGSSWTPRNNGLPAGVAITALAIDPKSPSTIYAGAAGFHSPHRSPSGIFKSSDGGSEWVNVLPSGPMGPSFIPVNALAIDPRTPSTIYAACGAVANPFTFGFVARSTDGGVSWDFSSFDRDIAYSVVIDPKKSKFVYAGRESGVHRSTNGGRKWRDARLGVTVTALAIDPRDRRTIFGIGSAYSSGDVVKVFVKSTDRGKHWTVSHPGLPQSGSEALVINSETPSILYAPVDTITPLTPNYHSALPIPYIFDTGIAGGIFRSADGGATWNSANLDNRLVHTLAIDPIVPTTLYAGVFSGGDAFVSKLNATGSGLVYSSYLGGMSDDSGHGVSVDMAGNAYVTGQTTSDDFPVRDPFQSARVHGSLISDAFVMKLNSAGDRLIFSTYLGGKGNDFGRGIVVDALGNINVAGITSSTNFGTSNPFQGRYGGGIFDAFVVKISAP